MSQMFSCPCPNGWHPCSAQSGMSLQVVHLLDYNNILTWFPFFWIVPFPSLINKQSATKAQLQRPIFVGYAGLSFIGCDLQYILSRFFWNQELHAFKLLCKSTAWTPYGGGRERGAGGLHKSDQLFHWRWWRRSSYLCLYKPRVIMQIQKFLEKVGGSLWPTPSIPHSWFGPSLLCKK